MENNVKVDLTQLTATTMRNVLSIVAQSRLDVVGAKIPIINQELATLESLERKLTSGELVVVEPQDAEDDDAGNNGD